MKRSKRQFLSANVKHAYWLSRKDDGRHFLVRNGKMAPKKWQKPTGLAEQRIRAIPISKIVPRELHPVNLEERKKYFMDIIKDGQIPIAPILVQPMADGRYYLIDGHSRLAAFKQLGYTKIQAVISKNPTELEQIVS